jgi:hypothetical protein
MTTRRETMRRVVSMAFALTMLSAGLFGTSSAQEATPMPGEASMATMERTNVRYVLPFAGDGLNPGLTVRAEEQGFCGHESLASPGRPDAWNCIGETSNEIFDPCFESPFSTPDEPGQLACVDSPFGTEVLLLTPTAPLPRFKEADTGPPPPQPAAVMPAPAAPDQPIPTGDKPPPGVPATAMDQSVPAVMPDPAETSGSLPWALELADGEQCALATGATAVFAGMRVNYFCSGGGSILGDPDRSQPVWAVTYLAEGAVASELVEVAVVWH